MDAENHILLGPPPTQKPKADKKRRYLALVVVGILTLGYSITEIVFSRILDSVGLLSDGVHNLSDVLSLFIAFMALMKSTSSSKDIYTYGWKRTEILGAVLNGAFLMSLAVYIIIEAIPKFFEINSPCNDIERLSGDWTYVIIAGSGLGINTLGTILFCILSGGHGHVHAGGGDHGHSHGGHGKKEKHGDDDHHGHAHKEKKKHDHGDDEHHGHAHKEKKKHDHADDEHHGHAHKEKKPKVDGHAHELKASHELVHEEDNGHGHSHGEKKEKKEGHEHAHGEKKEKKEGHGHAHGEKKEKKEELGHSLDEKEEKKGELGHSHGEKKEKKEGHGHSHGEKKEKKEGHGHAHGEKKEKKEGHGHSHGEKGSSILGLEEPRVDLGTYKDRDSHSINLEESDSDDDHDDHDEHDEHDDRDLNIHAVFLHYLGDALSSIILVITGVLVKKFPGSTWTYYLDPTASILIVILILYTTIPLLKRCSTILLQQTPNSLKLPSLKEKLRKIPGVQGIHDLHVWQLVDSIVIATLHVKILERDMISFDAIGSRVKKVFHKIGIHSITLQPEFIPDYKREQPGCEQYCVKNCDEDWCCKTDQIEMNVMDYNSTK